MPIRFRIKLTRSTKQQTMARSDLIRSSEDPRLQEAAGFRAEANRIDVEIRNLLTQAGPVESSNAHDPTAIADQSRRLSEKAEQLRNQAAELEREYRESVFAPESDRQEPAPGRFLVDHADALMREIGPRMAHPPAGPEHEPLRASVSFDPANSGKGHILRLFLECPLGGCTACLEPVELRLRELLDGLHVVEIPPAEAARRLDIHRSTVKRRLDNGTLNGRRGPSGEWADVFVDKLFKQTLADKEAAEDRDAEEDDRRQLRRLEDEDAGRQRSPE